MSGPRGVPRGPVSVQLVSVVNLTGGRGLVVASDRRIVKLLFCRLAPRTMLWVNASTVAAVEVLAVNAPVARSPWLVSPAWALPSLDALHGRRTIRVHRIAVRVVLATRLLTWSRAISSAPPSPPLPPPMYWSIGLRHIQDEAVVGIANQRRHGRALTSTFTFTETSVASGVDVVVGVAIGVFVAIGIEICMQFAVEL